MSERSTRPEVRNPLVLLPSAERIAALSPETRHELRLLLLDLARDAQVRAQESWRKHKAPMAMYWKAVAVYARHIARLLKEPA